MNDVATAEPSGMAATRGSTPSDRVAVPGTATPHRTDIDGLRALAVLPIVLFHLGISAFGGGFVGVDIFFVISGFLIGGTTTRELLAGTFSIARFYQRRLRRIFPALIAMLAGTTIAALFVLLPTELAEYAGSLAATAAFGANVYFWLHAGYFDAAATTRPLLHAWSLGVEEQYYLLFPLIAMLVVRAGRRLIWPTMALLLVVSLAASIWLTHRAPDANFYLLPTRAWELLLGVLVAITPLPMLDRRGLREIMALAGMATIVLTIAHYSSYTPFPGVHALPPCLGAAAILAAGSRGRSLAGAALSLPPVRFVGLISYSLYLWHWPVIVLVLQWLPSDRLTPAMQLASGAVSAALAIASWRWIETPFRRNRLSPRRVFGVSLAGAAAVIAAAIGLIITHGLPARLPPPVVRLAATLDYPHDPAWRAGRCFLIADTRFDAATCLAIRPHTPAVLLLGDSHGAQLWPGLSSVFRGTSVLQANASGCRPIIVPSGGVAARCTQLMRWIFEDYLPAHRPDLVILAGLWHDDDAGGLAATLTRLRALGIRALVIGPAPQWRVPLPRLLALAEWRHDAGLPQKMLTPGYGRHDEKFAAITSAGGARYVSLRRLLCTPACATRMANGEPVAFDDSHLTIPASRWVAIRLRDPALRLAPAPDR